MTPNSHKISRFLLLVTSACVCLQYLNQAAQADLATLTGYNFSAPIPDEECLERPKVELTQLQENQCHLLLVYNHSEVLQMSAHQLRAVSSRCACQLGSMVGLWEDSFAGSATVTVANKVEQLVEAHNGSHPDYIWSDLEVMFYHVSIHLATRGFFEQLNSNSSLASQLRDQGLTSDPSWRAVLRACRRIADDKHHLYRYLENLKLLDVEVFFRLVSVNEPVKLAYEASKACKLLNNFPPIHYKLIPDDLELVVADHAELKYIQQLDGLLGSGELDAKLRGASAKLPGCRRWHNRADPMSKLALECPMMLGDQLPVDWVRGNPSSANRSSLAIRCACQLLLHKEAWRGYFKDAHVQTIVETITDFFQRDGVPDLTSMSMAQIRSWYEDVMDRLTRNSHKTILEVVRTMSKTEDIMVPIRESSPLHKDALETIRRACNYIIFNHRKGATETGELKLVKYLDNLQYISQDPLFVFHLTLQDPNLFKLRAVTRMCKQYVE